MTNKSIRDYINLIENAQSEGVANSPLVRHIEKELTAIGYKKGTPEFDAHFKDAMRYYRQHGNFGNADTQGLADEVAEGWTKTPSGDYINQHTGVRSSKPPVKKKRGEKTGAEWDAIEKAKKDKEQGVAEAGDTAKGQKMLGKVHNRAADRVTSKQADKDPEYARKAQQTQDRAWDRLKDK